MTTRLDASLEPAVRVTAICHGEARSPPQQMTSVIWFFVGGVPQPRPYLGHAAGEARQTIAAKHAYPSRGRRGRDQRSLESCRPPPAGVTEAWPARATGWSKSRREGGSRGDDAERGRRGWRGRQGIDARSEERTASRTLLANLAQRTGPRSAAGSGRPRERGAEPSLAQLLASEEPGPIEGGPLAEAGRT